MERTSNGLFKDDKDYVLHRAVVAGHTDTVRQLISQGCSVNGGYIGDSATPLHLACLSGNAECCRLLIEAGANVNSRNVDGATPLCDASNGGSVECVQMLLHHGAVVNPKCSDTHPLHEAVLRNNLHVIDVLIAAGANLEAIDLHFGMPLHVAAYKDHLEAARKLLLAGANPNAAKTHQTALHMAAGNDCMDMCLLLLDFGAHIFAENSMGRRASEIAQTGSTLFCELKGRENTVSSLQQMCRWTIRKLLMPPRLKDIRKLGLPTALKRFLEFQ